MSSAGDGLTLRFPPGAAICAPGDHLVRSAGGRWTVYRVEDLLRLQRLRPALGDPSAVMIEEHLLDSMTAAYAGDVYLLLTAFEPAFAAKAEAVHAVAGGALRRRETGLLRAARDFPAAECEVVRRDASAPPG